MNPWISARLADERMRDLRATAGRARRRTGGGRTASAATTGRVGRRSLVQRAARALHGQRLRPA